MPDIDLFNFFRWWLGWIVTIYASIVTYQSLYGWYVWLMGEEKYISLVRRYVIVQGLRLRVRAFWGDVAVCVLLTVAFLIMWYAHHLSDDLAQRVRGAHEAQRYEQVMEQRVQNQVHLNEQPSQHF
jgi:hypothetical protein